jgi:hypothetical protein
VDAILKIIEFLFDPIGFLLDVIFPDSKQKHPVATGKRPGRERSMMRRKIRRR